MPAPRVHSGLRSFADVTALSEAVADAILTAARRSVAARGRFAIALSGGETPRGAYELLGTRRAGDVDWSKVDVYFTDERFVPPDHPSSNFAMASRAWLSRPGMTSMHVHAIPTTGGSPAACAERYERALRETLGGDAGTFDLALMGIGTDGHTASLFPDDGAALHERDRWVLAVRAPAGAEPRDRITLTLPVINGSRHVVFVAAGAAKRERVAQARSGRADIPAALARGVESTEWLIDAAAS